MQIDAFGTPEDAGKPERTVVEHTFDQIAIEADLAGQLEISKGIVEIQPRLLFDGGHIGQKEWQVLARDLGDAIRQSNWIACIVQFLETAAVEVAPENRTGV